MKPEKVPPNLTIDSDVGAELLRARVFDAVEIYGSGRTWSTAEHTRIRAHVQWIESGMWYVESGMQLIQFPVQGNTTVRTTRELHARSQNA